MNQSKQEDGRVPSDWKHIIKALRSGLGMTQDQFGELMGANPNTVARWERGESIPAQRAQRRTSELLSNPLAPPGHLSIPHYYWAGLIRSIRLQLGGISQAEFGRRIGVAAKTVNRWEGQTNEPRACHKKAILESWKESTGIDINNRQDLYCEKRSVFIEFPETAAIAHVNSTRELVALDNASEFLWAPSHNGLIEDMQFSPGRLISRSEFPGLVQVFDRELAPQERIRLNMRFTAHDMFPNENEWYGFRVRYPTGRLELRVKFPRSRPPVDWKSSALVGESMTDFPLDSVVAAEEEGRTVLEWTIRAPKLTGLYSLKWSW